MPRLRILVEFGGRVAVEFRFPMRAAGGWYTAAIRDAER